MDQSVLRDDGTREKIAKVGKVPEYPFLLYGALVRFIYHLST